MKLYNVFLLILSSTCTLSGASPVRSSQCVPVNEDGAALRMTNGAGISLFSNQVRINIVESYIEPSTFYPFGGFTISFHNDFCHALRVTFDFLNGRNFEALFSPWTSSARFVIPRGAGQGSIVRVSIRDN
jgi:hypothetical protein